MQGWKIENVDEEPKNPGWKIEPVEDLPPEFDVSAQQRKYDELSKEHPFAGSVMGSLADTSAAFQRAKDAIPVVGPLLTGAGNMMRAGVDALQGKDYQRQMKLLQDYDRTRQEQFQQRRPVQATAIDIAAPMLPLAVTMGAGGARPGQARPGSLGQVGESFGQGGKNIIANTAVNASDAELRKIRGDDRDPTNEALTGLAASSALNAFGKAIPKAIGYGLRRSAIGVPDESAIRLNERNPEINAALKQERIGPAGNTITGKEAMIHELGDEMSSNTSKLDAAKTARKEALSQLQQNLRAENIPYDTPEKINKALVTLRKQISADSGEAIDILAKAGVPNMSKDDLRGLMTDRLHAMSPQPNVPPLDKTGYTQLKKFRDYINNEHFGTTNPETGVRESFEPKQLKRFIQDIDKILGNSYYKGLEHGDYNHTALHEIHGFRQDIDSYLKKRAEDYDVHMKDLSIKTKLMQELLGNFRGADQNGLLLVHSKLQRFRDPDTRHYLEPLIKQLEGHTGADIMSDLDPYLKAQSSLKSRNFDTHLPPGSLPEEIEAQGLKGLGGTANTGKNIIENTKRLTPNPNAEELLRRLGELRGQDYTNRAKDLTTGDFFNQPYIRGSMLVNAMRAMAGGAMAPVMARLGFDPSMAQMGGALGAATALGTQVSGRRMYKLAVDVANNPTFKAISPKIESAFRQGPQAFISTIGKLSESDPTFKEFLINWHPGEENKQ